MNQSKRLLREYKNFLKLAHNINNYNIRTHTLRKLRYDFTNYLKDQDKVNELLFAKLKNDYERLNRIALIQNINVPYEEFKYTKMI